MPVLKRPAGSSARHDGRACGNCGVPGHRAERCPELCFACGEDHTYLECPTATARVRAAQQRARWRGGKGKWKAPLSKRSRKGTEWQKQTWDPTNDDPTPRKAAQAHRPSERTEISLASLFEKSEEELAEYLASLGLLHRPHCNMCDQDAKVTQCGRSRPMWTCSRDCRCIRQSVFVDNILGLQKVRMTLKEYASVLWCWCHNFSSEHCACITGRARSSVQSWYASLRSLVGGKERERQQGIIFSSEGKKHGFAHVQGDATRIRKKHERDSKKNITRTWHASVMGLLQRESLDVVVVPQPPVCVAVGQDGKPGAPPPEKEDKVYELLSEHLGSGCLLNSDGGRGGDGLYDKVVSQSPYARAARRLTAEGRPVSR